ncbi:MAG: glycosyltransferase [Sphingomonadales bacterium]|nr:glycosyltransferase [Sphingomonadales bacterium]
MTQHQPYFSVITVCFQEAQTLRHTLLSVAMQKGAAIEHWVIDGGSTDGTLEILREWDLEMKNADARRAEPGYRFHWISESDLGLYDAMNKGIVLSTGHFIGILNADDFYPHHRVLSRVRGQLKQTGADLLYADLNYVEARDFRRIVRTWKSGTYGKRSFYWGWMAPHPTLFIKKECYVRSGGYRLDLGTSADYEFMLRIFLMQKVQVTYLAKTIIHMRMGGVSNKGLKARWKANRMDRKAWQVNGLKPFFFTLLLKPFRKLAQFS